MKYEDIPEYSAVKYKETCTACGDTITVCTQERGDYYEYDTYVYVQCTCGEYVLFILPVN